MSAQISNGIKTKTVTAQNTGTDWVQINGDPGSWCSLPFSISTGSTSVVQLQRRAIGGSIVSVLCGTNGNGNAAEPTLPLSDAYAANAGYQFRLWVATGGYGNTVTLEIGA